jgi:hypothetical protein
MITKKLGKITFGWDPTANKGKGYWYVMGKDESFARAASHAEASKLGTPKQSEMPKKDAKDHKYYWTTNPKTGKPMRKKNRTGSGYEEADITGSKSLGQLASERMMGGEGLGKSLKGALKDKIGAAGTSLKRKFDPMNMLSKLPGGMGTLAATAYGKKRGRDPKDISYFTGIHAPEQEAVPEKAEKVTASKVGGKSSGGGMGRGAVGLLKEIKQTIVDKFEDDKKQKEIENNWDEQKKAEEDKKHKELIDAIHGIHGGDAGPKKEEKRGGGLLSMLGDFLGNFMGRGKGLLGRVGGIAKKVGKGVLSAGKSIARGGKNLVMKAGGAAKKGFSAMKSGLGMGSKTASVVSKGLDTTKAALVQAKPSTAVKVAETAQKTGSAIAKVSGTASRMGGVTSKLIKGGGKLLGFLKSIPGLSVIGAGADLIMRVSELQEKVKSGKVKESEYKKEMTKVVGEAAAAGLLPIMGAALGSFVPGVGTLVGGLAGGAAALLGGDKIGGWLAGKMYDFFVDGKKGGDEKTASASASKTTASAIPSKAKPAATSPAASKPASVPSASPAATPPSNLGSRAAQATQVNQSLVGPAAQQQQSPVLVNKTTNVVNKSGGSGGGGQGGVRNDEPVLQRVQYGNMRAV